MIKKNIKSQENLLTVVDIKDNIDLKIKKEQDYIIKILDNNEDVDIPVINLTLEEEEKYELIDVKIPKINNDNKDLVKKITTSNKYRCN